MLKRIAVRLAGLFFIVMGFSLMYKVYHSKDQISGVGLKMIIELYGVPFPAFLLAFSLFAMVCYGCILYASGKQKTVLTS